MLSYYLFANHHLEKRPLMVVPCFEGPEINVYANKKYYHRFGNSLRLAKFFIYVKLNIVSQTPWVIHNDLEVLSHSSIYLTSFK